MGIVVWVLLILVVFHFAEAGVRQEQLVLVHLTGVDHVHAVHVGDGKMMSILLYATHEPAWSAGMLYHGHVLLQFIKGSLVLRQLAKVHGRNIMVLLLRGVNILNLGKIVGVDVLVRV